MHSLERELSLLLINSGKYLGKIYFTTKILFLWTTRVVLQLSHVDPLCVPPRSTPISVFVVYCQLYHIWTSYCLMLSFFGVHLRILVWSHCTPSLLLHQSAMRRDQVCRSSNKGGCLIKLPFSIYKPDPFDHTAYLIPPLSRRLSTSLLSSCLSEDRMRVVEPSPPLAVKIWVHSV